MEDQEKRISYQAGITRTPSDFLCSEGELAECIGLTSDGEELKVLTPLTVKVSAQDTGNRRLVFVHKLGNGTENYIYEGKEATNPTSYKLYYDGSELGANGSSSHSSPISANHIKAIGKTLVVAMNDGLHYFLFKNTSNSGSYQYIGSTIPHPHMAFGLDGEPGGYVIRGMFPDGDVTSGFKYISVGGISGTQDSDRTVYNDSIHGLYAKGKDMAAESKSFVLPFFVRYALKLYDGSYTHISNPIPMFPNSTSPCFWVTDYFFLHAMYLVYKNFQEYNDWTDIVKSISIFVSRGIELCDTTVDAVDEDWGQHYERACARWAVGGPAQDAPPFGPHYPLVLREMLELKDELCSESVFYHLCDISATERKSSWTQLKNNFSHHTLKNLVTQEQLPYDNYYSLAPLSADYLYDYNNRLNMARVKRGFFEGFLNFSGLWGNDPHTYDIYVRIASENGDRVVHALVLSTKEYLGHYLFYPDPRANHITVYEDQRLMLDEDLIEHPGLNGAYFCGGWPEVPAPGFSFISGTGTLDYSDIDVRPEELFSYIVTSEVNNPFVFLAHGYNRVGTGYVIGMAAQTQALSQGQFGQYPLMVFTTEGIWAMSLNDTGLFTAIHPMSREVAWKNNAAITPVDGAVFFVSKKGLMVLEGSKVVCVSEKLNGKAFATNGTPVDGQGLSPSVGTLGQDIHVCSDGTPFLGFLLDASLRIAYDYVDSRLLLLNSTKDYCWVYSLKTGSFSKLAVGSFYNVVNAYPDYLVQQSDNVVYTLYEKTREETVVTRQRGFLLTRPLKLGGALRVASLRELKNVGYWEEASDDSESEASDDSESEASDDSESWVKTMILVSDDLVHWYEDQSRFGAGAKYFRIALFVNLLPTERLSGTILKVRPVRNGVLR